MPLKAAFFDVGDTLVEHWAPGDVVGAMSRAQVCAAFGETEWLDELLKADLSPAPPESYAQRLLRRSAGDPRFEPETARQETNRWYEEWFRSRKIELDGIDIDRLRSIMCVALNEISSPVPGAFDALRWCHERGLRVVLVSNTLQRGDAEALQDWRRFALHDAIHGIVTSHSAGWQKPHPAIFERALEVAQASPEEVFHVGDNLIADVWGAKQVGIRAVWRRSARAVPPTAARGTIPGRAAREPDECRHPSERLYLDQGDMRCGTCGAALAIDIRPDAVVDDLTQLQAAVGPWLGAGVA